MSVYLPEHRTADGAVYRWRLKHRRLRIAKRKKSRWLRTAGRIWDVRNAGEHDLCSHCRAIVDGSRTFIWRDVYVCSDECDKACSDDLDRAGN